MSEASNLRKTTYRLYPTPKQALALAQLLRLHQQLYNAALEER
ncbi:MAG: helix-turn-helix domain-containing protein, partial [Comamonas sp.]|nr:helix-turn-helix domain-containing protein [Comamonas sp.]